MTEPNAETATALRKEYGRYGKLASPSDRTDITTCPRWVKVALTRKALYDLPYSECLSGINRSPSTLGDYARSPAGKAWISQVHKFADDPVEMSRAILKSSAPAFTLDMLAVLEQALAVGDYKEAGKMLRDLHDRVGVVRHEEKTHTPTTITINLPGARPDPIMIDSEVVEVETLPGDDQD